MPANSMQLRSGQTGICGPAEASGQNHPHQAHRHQQGAPLSQDLPPQGEGGGSERRTHSHSPSPAPSSTPLLTATHTPLTNAPQGRKNGEGGEDTGQGERDEPRRVTGQGRPRSPKGCRVQKEKKERKNGKESLRLLEAPVRKIILQMHTPARTSQCWSRQTRHGLCVHLNAPGQRHGQQSVSGTADPGADLCLRVVPLDWGGGVCGLWVGGLVSFWAIWPYVPAYPPPPLGGVWVGGWVGDLYCCFLCFQLQRHFF